MRRFEWKAWPIAIAALGLLALGRVGRAGEAGPAATAAWTPEFYAFCVEMPSANPRPLPEQAKLLRELGFDGVGYPLWLDADLDKNLRALDEAGLKVYLLYMTVHVQPGAQPFDPRAAEAIRKLKGRPTTICVLLQGLKPGDPQGTEPAVKALRQLGDLAAASGLRVSIYHHTGDWTASLLDALKVAKQANHPAVGVNFNLCHWLMVDGDKDYRPVLRDNAAKLFVVTINGATLGSKTWTNGLIQPLDRGDFDNRQLLALLRQIGYRGPIGLMCYGIPDPARDHLQRSMKVWKRWHAD